MNKINYCSEKEQINKKNSSAIIRENSFSIIFSLLFLLFTNYAFSQNYNWITPNQTYLKMYISSDGMYRIDKNDFVNAGITVSSIDPRTVKLYYKGNQVPIYFFGEENGTFDDADYFDFFGIRNYGGLTNAHDINNNVIYTTDEYFNLYSDTSSYFVGWGGAFGLRYVDYVNSSSNLYPLDYYYQKYHFEQDLVYSLGQNISGTDYGNFSNDKYIGEGWYWRTMQTSNFFDQVFNVNSLSGTPQQCRLKVFAYPVNQSTTITNEHRLALKMNNTTQLDTMYRDNFNRFDTTVFFSSSILVNGNNTMRFLSRPATGFSGTINFDMFEISYPRQFVFDSNAISFNSDISDSTSKIFKVKGYVSSNPLSIIDTKNNIRISNFTSSGDTLIFIGKGNGNYQIVNKGITKKPFRIKQRQVPNLVTSSTGADYLIVYNKLFETPAEQLRQYRNTHDGFRSVKAEIEDIFDVFNYGMEDPVAIRRFTKNIYDTWQTPKVKFLCLFGRGSLDPKKNFSSSNYYRNLIPVYGNPITDGYFANFNFGAFTYMHQISVGRLPAYTLQEAQDMVNKVINYEGQGLQQWPKTNLFISGGETVSQQLQFAAQSDYFINTYVKVPPSSLFPVRAYINDSLGLLNYNYSDSIKNSINRGALCVNFIAHAGNGYWDYVYDDPVVLSNGNKLPLILSMTCFTGKMADGSFRSYGEKYTTYQNKGSLGFIGTTGWSFSGTGNTYNDYLLRGINQDTLRRIGDIISYASRKLSPDSASFAAKNTNNCYNLMGDPAAKLILPSFPEFEIKASDFSLSNNRPKLRERFLLNIFPKNIGLNADSCKIRLDVLRGNYVYFRKDTVVHDWGFIDTLNYNLKIDTLGSYTIKIDLDVDNWFPLENSSNNQLIFPLEVKNNSFVPLRPVNNSVLSNDTIEFVGNNPDIKSLQNNVKLLLQVDTSQIFNSPLLKSYLKNNFTGPVTKFSVDIPFIDTNITYFWRMTNIINNDTLDWSDLRRFKRRNNSNNGLILDSTLKINISTLKDYSLFDFWNIFPQNFSYSLNTFQGNILASCWGGDPWEPSYLRINERQKTLITNINWSGLYVAIIHKHTYLPVSTNHIYFSSASSSDSLLNILNTVDSTKIVCIVKLVPSIATNTFNVATKNKLRDMGSTKVDSFVVNSWARWSFVTAKGLPSPIVSEAYSNTGWFAVNAPYSSTNLFPYGTITQFFGPAQTWQNFNWQQEVFPNSSLYFDVYGINRNNQETLLMSNITTNNNVDLSGINAYQYPNLKLITRLSIDTISGYQSPVFKGINLNYVGPPEIALDNNSIFKSDSVVSAGDSIGIGGSYYNVGYVPLNGHVRSFYALDGAGNKVLLRSDTILSQLKVDSSMFVKATFKVNGLPIHKKYTNQVSIVLEVNALNQNDIYDYNNSVISTFFVKGSLTEFNTEVFSDGVKLYGNDYVRSNPDMMIKLSGKSIDELLASDTSVFRILLNNQFISLNQGDAKSNNKTNLIKETDKGNLVLKFTPQLQNGMNDLKLISFKNNSYDTAKFVLNVTNETSLKDVYNFPNPMKTETVFSFTLTGNQLPTECKIKIYTSAGRVIKEILVPAGIGFNQISWDGRDGDGDYIANGVYFYRVVFKGSAETISDIRKLVVLK